MQLRAIVEYQISLPMQNMILPLTQLELLLANEAAVAIELWLGILIVYYFSIVGKHFIIFCIFSPYSAKHARLIIFGTVFDTYYFLNPAYSKLLLELKAAFCV